VPDALTVADTGAPACIALADERLAATERARGHGLMIGGYTTGDHALSTLAAGIRLLEQAAETGGPREDIAARATALERQAAALLARLVKLRVENTASATPSQRAA
jgi:hypothetical protein